MATKFSERVLEAVSKIPRGKVSTYADIAMAAGKPKAFRAVGNALGKNQHPVIIPCHRVVRSDGSVGRYSGVLSKERLLKSEGIKIVDGKIDLAGSRASLNKSGS